VERLGAVVLAGGRSTRFGSDKASALLLGRPLLAWVIASVSEVVSDVVVVRARGQRLPSIDDDGRVRVVEDRHEGKGPLAGMVAGFEAAATPLVVVASCDAPLLRPGLVGGIARLAGGHDIVLPHANGHPQPLLAIYRVATCLPNFEAAVERDDLKITGAYTGLAVRVVREEELMRFDPGLLSFMNANTPEALGALEPRARELGPAL